MEETVLTLIEGIQIFGCCAAIVAWIIHNQGLLLPKQRFASSLMKNLIFRRKSVMDYEKGRFIAFCYENDEDATHYISLVRRAFGDFYSVYKLNDDAKSWRLIAEWNYVHGSLLSPIEGLVYTKDFNEEEMKDWF